MKQVFEVREDETAFFISRPNKYVGEVRIASTGVIELIHIHDPGRLTELLYEGNKVKIRKAENPNRKTGWDLIAAQKGDKFILVNSAFHSKIAYNILCDREISPLGALKRIKGEVKYRESRFDFHLIGNKDEEIWLEVKGCTLSEDGVAKFPDAPTVRGQRHLKELIEIKENGVRAVVVFLIFSNAGYFRAKGETDPVFAEVFKEAAEKGVEIYPLQLSYDAGKIFYERVIEYGV